eukprot:Anaeramoba_ignava/c21619_g2_i1.p1 GENE.c21619_g2_i1~~c21619_g2_i1.p1  ORF type:complete len:1261 (+),score=322.49 c21619_g2_i1:827-4609(+)
MRSKSRLWRLLSTNLRKQQDQSKIPKKHKHKEGVIRDYNAEITKMYQSMKTWFTHTSIERLIPEPITYNHNEFLSLIHSNLLNPNKNKWDLKTPTDENIQKLHNSLWFHLINLQNIFNDIYTNIQFIEDLPSYVHFLVKKVLKPRMNYPPLMLKMVLYQNLVLQNRSQMNQFNLTTINAPLLNLYPLFVLDGKIYPQIEEDLQKRQPIIMDSARKFASFKTHHESLNRDYLELSTSLYENVPTTETVYRTCTYTTTYTDSNGNTQTQYHSHQVAFTFYITRVEKNTSIESKMIYNRKEAETYLVPAKNPNNTLGFNNISTYMIYLDFADQSVDIAKKQQFQLQDYPIDDLWKKSINWFYKMLNFDSSSSELKEYPLAQLLIKEFTYIIGMQFIRNNHEQLDAVAQIIIDHPAHIPRIAPLFNPQLIPKRTLDYYSRIMQTYVRHEESLCSPVLLSFQFNEWLESKPNQDEIKRAIAIFLQYSRKEIFRIYPVLATFNTQSLLIMCIFEYPKNLIPVIEQVMATTLEKQAIPALWDIFAQLPFAKLQLQDVQKIVSMISQPLITTLTQMITNQTLYDYFESDLLTSLMRFFEAFIVSICQNPQIVPISREFSPSLSSQILYNLYIPFIGSVILNSQQFPAFRENSSFVDQAFMSFCRSLSTLQTVYQWSLIEFMNFFYTTLSKMNIPYVISKYFQHFSSISNWEQTIPTMEFINQLLMLSVTAHQDLIRIVVSRLPWKQTEQSLVDPQNPQSFFFYETLFQIILNLIQRYQRFSDANYARIFLNFLDIVSKSLSWENLNANAYQSLLESSTADPNFMQYNRREKLDFSNEFTSQKFPPNITNLEQRGFTLINAIRKIGFFDNDINYDHIIPFIQFVTNLLLASAQIIRTEPIEEQEGFWKRLFKRKKKIDLGPEFAKVPLFAIPFSEKNFTLVFMDLIRVALIDVTQDKHNLMFVFDAFSLQNAQVSLLLLKGCSDYLENNPRVSHKIIFSSCEKIRNLDDFVVVSEKAHDCFFPIKDNYSMFLDHFGLIDVDENALVKSSIENSSFLSFFTFVTKRLKDNNNSIGIPDTFSLLDKILSLLVNANLQFRYEFKFFYLFDLFIRGIDSLFHQDNTDFNQKFADKLKLLQEKLQNLTKKKGCKKIIEGMDKKDEVSSQCLISFQLLKIAFELVFPNCLKNKKTKESYQKDFNNILNAKKNSVFRPQIEKIESIFSFKSQDITPPQIINLLIRELFVNFISNGNDYFIAFLDESRKNGEWIILK